MIQNFYIFGTGRSGTTLLQSILDAHTAIAVPPESYLVLHLDKKYKGVTNWSEAVISKFIDDLYTDRPFRLVWRVPRRNVEEAFELAAPVQNFEHACNVVRSSFQESYRAKSISCFGDKKPLNSLFADRVIAVSPTAKIIHLVRDPRGTGNGQINTFKRRDALLVGHSWANQNRAILALKEKYPQRYFLLKYEDLVIHTEQTIRDTCAFLGLEFQPKMLIDYRTSTTKRFDQYTEQYKDKHLSLLEPIDPKIANKWKTKLLPKHRKRIEIATHIVAAMLGYDFEKPNMNFGMAIWWPISKFRAFLRLSVLRIYFAVPFAVRKFILQIRSKRGDHKYLLKDEKKATV